MGNQLPSSCRQNKCKHCPAVPRGAPAPLSPDEVFPGASRTTAHQRQEATPVLMDSDGLFCFIYFLFIFQMVYFKLRAPATSDPPRTPATSITEHLTPRLPRVLSLHSASTSPQDCGTNQGAPARTNAELWLRSQQTLI